MKASFVDLFCAVLFLGWAAMAAAGYGDVPASPLPRGNESQSGCRLDLSNELFGGVGDACVRGGLDRSRCCPVLAAWLFAAHARSALELPEEAEEDGVDRPMMPEDNEKCVESLQSALERRDIRLPRPNATCDTVLCFCGIHLHHIGTLRCPAAFNLSGDTAAPTAAVRRLERDCRNASYAGCSRCLRSLDKVKKGNGGGGDGGDRAARMFAWDCELMSLTWLLARNKTAYIPTVSAVLRALLYTGLPAAGGGRCSPDLENMPLAVDSLQFQHLGSDEVNSAALPTRRPLDRLLSASFSLAVVFAGVPFF
ncbi:putative GPI-anchored protein At4g28100 [Curcuma longa]|uniref:putative GPI-anchored protein At4g28100 n=1 Tax=Curcuma longa TaxID=136217 RepID=UPI003D9EFB9D